jgi:asparagine synthase (glutamine-hydrolysing)
MCGIAGIINLANKPIEPHYLIQMNRSIRHRGQDDEGYILIERPTGKFALASGPDSPPEIRNRFPSLDNNHLAGQATIGLAHRRFSIIDLTIGGHQPAFSHNRSCCLVFNGEIYNFLEIRRELEGTGYLFHTNSDTEVLAGAYHTWGTQCFKYFNGFWALAIYDFAQQQLILSRDRLGKKPLYWVKKDDYVFFASEIKALLQIPMISQTTRVNESAIYPWLTFGLRDLNEHTFFDGIYKLASASWGVVNEQFPKNTKSYWQVPGTRLNEREISKSEAANCIRDTLINAITLRLRADVPLSVELSGGMDSSALVALAAQIQPQNLTTYTVRFPDAEANEEPFAQLVAKHYDVDYQVIDPILDNFWSQLLAFTYLEEEPYHAPNLQTNQSIWTLMRAKGTKVSLNGGGGDELFAGYGGYYLHAQLENLKSGYIKHLIENIIHWSERDNLVKNTLLSVGSPLLAMPIVSHYFKRYKGEADYTYILNVPKAAPFMFHNLTELLHSDLVKTKIPYWLSSGDKGSMGIPFEVRSPFLDYHLVELVVQLPTTYLIRHGWHKWILRQTLSRDLPDQILWRKKKMGFPFPFERFFAESQPIIDTIFKHAQNPYLDLTKKRLFQHNWWAISFMLWYELFINNNLKLFHEINSLVIRSTSASETAYIPEFLNSVHLL